MNTTLALPESSLLAELERANFPRHEFTVETAHRLGLELAAVLCRRFPGLDHVLVAKQIESDFLEWALQNGVYRSRLDARGRPYRS